MSDEEMTLVPDEAPAAKVDGNTAKLSTEVTEFSGIMAAIRHAVRLGKTNDEVLAYAFEVFPESDPANGGRTSKNNVSWSRADARKEGILYYEDAPIGDLAGEPIEKLYDLIAVRRKLEGDPLYVAPKPEKAEGEPAAEKPKRTRKKKEAQAEPAPEADALA